MSGTKVEELGAKFANLPDNIFSGIKDLEHIDRFDRQRAKFVMSTLKNDLGVGIPRLVYELVTLYLFAESTLESRIARAKQIRAIPLKGKSRKLGTMSKLKKERVLASKARTNNLLMDTSTSLIPPPVKQPGERARHTQNRKMRMNNRAVMASSETRSIISLALAEVNSEGGAIGHTNS